MRSRSSGGHSHTEEIFATGTVPAARERCCARDRESSPQLVDGPILVRSQAACASGQTLLQMAKQGKTKGKTGDATQRNGNDRTQREAWAGLGVRRRQGARGCPALLPLPEHNLLTSDIAAPTARLATLTPQPSAKALLCQTCHPCRLTRPATPATLGTSPRARLSSHCLPRSEVRSRTKDSRARAPSFPAPRFPRSFFIRKTEGWQRREQLACATLGWNRTSLRMSG